MVNAFINNREGRLRFLFERDLPASVYPLFREADAGGTEVIRFARLPASTKGPRYFPAAGVLQSPPDFVLLGVFAGRLRSGRHQILKIEADWPALLGGMVAWVDAFQPTELLLPLFADAVVAHLLRAGYGHVADPWDAFYATAPAHTPAADAIHAAMVEHGTVSLAGGPPVVL